MTAHLETPVVAHSTNGEKTTFPFAFFVADPGGASRGIEVYLTRNHDTTLVDPALYSVQYRPEYEGGQVLFQTAPMKDQILTICRKTSITQGEELVGGLALYSAQLERFARKTQAIDQEVREDLKRAVKVPVGSGIDPDDWWAGAQLMFNEFQDKYDRLMEVYDRILAGTATTSHHIVDFAITQKTIRIALPEGWTITIRPFVVCTVVGGPTDVTITPVATEVPGSGLVYRHVDFTFPTSLIGKRCNAWIAGGY